MTKSRIFLFLLIAFIAGVAVVSFVYFPIYFILVSFIFGAVISVIGFSQKSKNIIVGGFVLIFFTFGAFWFNFQEKEKPDLSLFYVAPANFSGVVYEEPRNTVNSKQIRIRIDKVNGDKVRNFQVLVVTRRYPEFSVGDELEFSGILEKQENLGSFDYESYLAKDDIYGFILFPKVDKVGKSSDYKLKFALILSRVKNSFEEKISTSLPEPHAAFLKGILLGDRETLPKNLANDFKRTGTSHIVALSGYNITILARVVVWLLLFLYIPFRFSFWIASIFIFLFVLLTGASASVVRAAIMGVLTLLARNEGRIYNMTNALVFAGALMILQNPKILRFDAGFQLSFLATIGLVYLAPKIEIIFERLIDKINNVIYKEGRLKDRFIKDIKKEKTIDFKKIFIETLSAQIMVLPLLVYLFGQISVISPITNILILAAMPYAMLFGFLTALAGFLFEPLAFAFGFISWILIGFQIKTIEFFSKLPIASFSAGKAIVIFLLVIYGSTLFKIFKSKILKNYF